jgi:hypothetical protein
LCRGNAAAPGRRTWRAVRAEKPKTDPPARLPITVAPYCARAGRRLGIRVGLGWLRMMMGRPTQRL